MAAIQCVSNPYLSGTLSSSAFATISTRFEDKRPAQLYALWKELILRDDHCLSAARVIPNTDAFLAQTLALIYRQRFGRLITQHQASCMDDARVIESEAIAEQLQQIPFHLQRGVRTRQLEIRFLTITGYCPFEHYTVSRRPWAEKRREIMQV